MRSVLRAGNTICQSRRSICSTLPRYTTPNTKKRRCSLEDPLVKPIEIDLIGAPDPVSNMRPVRYYVPALESDEEKEWRLMQREVDEFNQEFWTQNNILFAEAKEKYENQLIANKEQVTAEAMSAFYKDFLNKAYDRQMAYNQAWWKRNTAMLLPGLKAAFRGIRRPPQRVESVRTGFWDKSFES